MILPILATALRDPSSSASASLCHCNCNCCNCCQVQSIYYDALPRCPNKWILVPEKDAALIKHRSPILLSSSSCCIPACVMPFRAVTRRDHWSIPNAVKVTNCRSIQAGKLSIDRSHSPRCFVILGLII